VVVVVVVVVIIVARVIVIIIIIRRVYNRGSKLKRFLSATHTLTTKH